MFKVGEKVVCIDASPVRADCQVGMPLRLTLSAVYVVASIHTEPGLAGYGVRLEELPNPSIIWSDGEEREWSYDSHRFRPVSSVEDKTEISAQV